MFNPTPLWASMFGGPGALRSWEFVTALSPDFTFTRSSSATRVNASGVVETVGNNVPRFDYNPSTLAPLGLLIEGQSTNLIMQSGAMSTAPWALIAGATSAAAGGGRVNPDGSAAQQFNFPAGGDFVRQIVTGITAAVTYTASVWVRQAAAGAATNIRLTTNNTAAWNTGFSQRFAVTTQWQRIVLSGQITSGTSMYLMFGATDAAGAADAACSGNVELWGAQIELQPAATSYIPTTASAATRANDICTCPISGWWSSSQGTLLVDAAVYPAHANAPTWPHIINVDDGTTANTFQVFVQVNASNRDYGMFSRQAGVNQVNVGVGIGLSAASSHKIAVGWNYGSGFWRGSVDGAAIITQAEGSMPTGVTTLRLGYVSQGGVRHIKRIAYFSTMLDDATIRAIST